MSIIDKIILAIKMICLKNNISLADVEIIFSIFEKIVIIIYYISLIYFLIFNQIFNSLLWEKGVVCFVKSNRFTKRLLDWLLSVVMALSCFSGVLTSYVEREEPKSKNRKIPYSYINFLSIDYTICTAFSAMTKHKNEFIRTEQLKLLLIPSFKKLFCEFWCRL